jgi:phage-related protein
MYGVLGDETAATTTISNFMKLETSTDNLNNLLNSATGIWAVYGDSIPLDGLAESVNETAKVGQITGNLADALNWAGVSEDTFNESLAACTSEQERQQLIVDTLNGLYSESADKYRENNASIIAAREANLAYQESLAAVGGAMEPLMTQFTSLKAQLLSSLVPGIQQPCTAFQNLFSGVSSAESDVANAVLSIINAVLAQLQSLLPQLMTIISAVLSGVIQSISGALPSLLTMVVGLIQQIFNTLLSSAPTILSAVLSLLQQVISMMTAYLPEFVTTALTLIVFMGVDFLMKSLLR